MDNVKYKRILLKLSGEALMGDSGYGIDVPTVDRIANDIKQAVSLGVEIACVVGGGNIFRGLSAATEGMDRASADYMGMLATVMNALALENALEKVGVSARTLSAIPMDTVCEPYVRPRALHHLNLGHVVIFAAGTGNPFFTTDTAAALRAIEMNCDVLAKGTQVDGVYSVDPHMNSDAKRFDKLSYRDVLAKDLKFMDGAAIALARDNNLPVVVFSIKENDNFSNVVQGTAVSTIVQ